MTPGPNRPGTNFGANAKGIEKMGLIVVTGSLNMDLVVRTDRLPRLGETILGGEFFSAGGGKGANQAVACARLGARARMIGAVGEDSFGRALLEGLSADGVDTGGVAVLSGVSTGAAAITILPGGENAIIVAPGANGRVTPERVRASANLYEGAGAALFQLEIPPESVAEGLRCARAAGAKTMLDPAPACSLPEEIWPLVDLLCPNELELAALGGSEDPDEAAANLLARGVGAVAGHFGSKGAVLYDRTGKRFFPAFPVTSVDTTAAGDTFSAAVAVRLAEGSSPAEAIPFACAAAALACTVLGAQPSLPRREQVARFLAERAGD
jgi:ribokinase